MCFRNASQVFKEHGVPRGELLRRPTPLSARTLQQYYVNYFRILLRIRRAGTSENTARMHHVGEALGGGTPLQIDVAAGRGNLPPHIPTAAAAMGVG